MNRRLHNATLAATVSGFLLMFGLVAAEPASFTAASADSMAGPPLGSTVAMPTAATIDSPAHGIPARDGAAIDAARSALLAARIDARARAFEARMARSAERASVGDTVTSAMAFAAEISTEVALVSALGALDASGRAATAPAPADAALDERRRHAQRIRGAMAVPYFSFAQGLRGAGS